MDPDVVLADLGTKSSREATNAMFRGRVDRSYSNTIKASDRTDVDDTAFTTTLFVRKFE